MRPIIAIRLLALISGILAVGLLGLAAAWTDQHREANCWREAFEESQPPPEGVC